VSVGNGFLADDSKSDESNAMRSALPNRHPRAISGADYFFGAATHAVQ
jgi:hypothetical protein